MGGTVSGMSPATLSSLSRPRRPLLQVIAVLTTYSTSTYSPRSGAPTRRSSAISSSVVRGFELTNLNRIRTGVHQLNVPEAVRWRARSPSSTPT